MPADKQERRRILIAEDEPMLAITLQELLIGAGFEIAGVAGKVEKAVALIESDACDAAILDANLSGVIASPVALALAARGLPFIMLSGYTSGCFFWSPSASEALPAGSAHSGSELRYAQAIILLWSGAAMGSKSTTPGCPYREPAQPPWPARTVCRVFLGCPACG
jgi:hypothetical protein